MIKTKVVWQISSLSVIVYDYSVFCVMFIHDHHSECEQYADCWKSFH